MKRNGNFNSHTRSGSRKFKRNYEDGNFEWKWKRLLRGKHFTTGRSPNAAFYLSIVRSFVRFPRKTRWRSFTSVLPIVRFLLSSKWIPTHRRLNKPHTRVVSRFRWRRDAVTPRCECNACGCVMPGINAVKLFFAAREWPFPLNLIPRSCVTKWSYFFNIWPFRTR